MQRYLKKALKTYKARRDLFCPILKTEFENLFRFQNLLVVWPFGLKF